MNYYPQLLNGMIAQKPYTPGKEYKTVSNDLPSGYRYSYAWRGAGLTGQPSGPLGRWEIPYSTLTDAEAATLESFFVSMQGRYGQFTFLDPAGNLVQNSENLSDISWTAYNAVSVSASGVADPFGGTGAQTLTSSGTNSMLATSILPAGGASGFVLCVSAWVRPQAAQTLYIGMVDSGFSTLSGGISWTLAANAWKRISARITLATSSSVSMLIGGLASWSGTSIDIFGSQCVANSGPGGYASTPGNYGYHTNCQFDIDTLTLEYNGYNKTAARVVIVETN